MTGRRFFCSLMACSVTTDNIHRFKGIELWLLVIHTYSNCWEIIVYVRAVGGTSSYHISHTYVGHVRALYIYPFPFFCCLLWGYVLVKYVNSRPWTTLQLFTIPRSLAPAHLHTCMATTRCGFARRVGSSYRLVFRVFCVPVRILISTYVYTYCYIW